MYVVRPRVLGRALQVMGDAEKEIAEARYMLVCVVE